MPHPQQNKRSQLARNIFYGVSSWVLPIVPTLVATPIVLSKLGKDQYGVLTIFLGFISYFFTIAIGKVAGKYVTEFLSSGDTKAVSPVISATLIVTTAAALLSTLAVAAAAGPIVDEVLLIGGELRNEAMVAVYVASATVLTTAAAQTFLLLLQGLHRFDRYFLLANFTSVSFSLGGLALAWKGYGFVSILIWNLITWAIAGVLAGAFVKAALPEFVFTVQIPREIWLLVARYAGSVVGYQLFGNVLLLFERGWIMRKFGPEALTFYVIPMTLAMYVHAFTASLVVSIFPTLNELLAEPEKLRTLYRYSTKLILAMIAFAIVTAAICGRTFLIVWLGDTAFAEISASLLIIHTITFSILALNTIAWHMAEGFRAASLNAYATLGWMLIGVAAMIVLSPYWEIAGVGAGRLIGVLPFVPMILLVEHRFLNGVDWRFWLTSISQLALCFAVVAFLEFFLLRALGTNWLSISIAVGLGAIGFATVALLCRYISVKDIEDARSFMLRRNSSKVASEPA